MTENTLQTPAKTERDILRVTGGNAKDNGLCPTCGNLVPKDEIAATLPRRQRAIYDAVVRSGRAGISSERIFHQVYGLDPTGGPKSINLISVLVHNLNLRLAPYRLRVEGRRGPHGSYKLVAF